MAKFRLRKRNAQTGLNRELDHSQRFLINSSFRFLQNFITRYRGHIRDENFFRPVTERITPELFRKIFTASTTPTLRRIILALDKDDKVNLGRENLGEVMQKLWEHPACNPKFRVALSEYLNVELLMLSSSLQNDPAPDAKRFTSLGDFFKLSDAERDLLLLARLIEGFWECDEWRGKLSYGKYNRIACALGLDEATLQKISRKDSRLRKLDCLDDDLAFNYDLLPYLCGADATPLEDDYFSPYSGEVLPWDFFGELAGKHGEVLSALLAKKSRTTGLHLLFYGAPGTGKTSFAAALAAKLGRSAYFIKQDTHNRLSAIQVCELQRDRDTSLIVVDEADKLLDCAEMNFLGLRKTNGDKGGLNAVLDCVKTPCIWIANLPASALDESCRRRFDYSIEFKVLTSEQRQRIWLNAAKKHQVKLSSDMVAQLATRYPVSAGGIELALRNFSAMDGKTVEEKIGKILVPHCELMKTPTQKAPAVSRDYLLDGLNIRGDLKLPEIIAALRNYLTGSLDDPDQPRMNLLFSGPPGSGKTEFVKHLSQTLGVPVVTKMASDILSKWVGGTEQNIAAAFAEAESSRAMLFLDELDGLLQNRERAQRNWEVTQVNELLHRMENFNGVLIGATNFLRNLDPATARRFTFKIEFNYLDSTGKKLFFERMFQSSLNSAETARLAAIPNLTPGDFRTVRQSLFYLGTVSDNAHRLAALEHEAAAKAGTTKRLGF